MKYFQSHLYRLERMNPDAGLITAQELAIKRAHEDYLFKHKDADAL